MCEKIYRLSHKTTEHISIESFTKIHTFQYAYNIKFFKCIYIYIKEMCGVLYTPYMHIFKRRCMSKYPSFWLKELYICFYKTGKSVGFQHYVLGSPGLLCLSLDLYYYLVFCLCLCIYLFISDHFSLHLLVYLDLCLCLCPLTPCSLPLLSKFPCLAYMHKLAQNLILKIMTWCWAKYSHLLSLLPTSLLLYITK